MLTSNDSSIKHFKLDPNGVDQNSSACSSCTLEFDGSSKGNPGQAGAGAITRSDDGSLMKKPKSSEAKSKMRGSLARAIKLDRPSE